MYSNIGATKSVGINRYSSPTYETIAILHQNLLAKKCMFLQFPYALRYVTHQFQSCVASSNILLFTRSSDIAYYKTNVTCMWYNQSLLLFSRQMTC